MRLEIHVFHHFPGGDGVGAKVDQVLESLTTIRQELNDMGIKTNAAVAELMTEAQDSKGKLATLTTTVLGFPAIVAAAVADALAAADVDDETAAAAISAARQDISDAVDQAMAATEINPDPEPESGEEPPETAPAA